jgi:hypothetical protein
MMGVPVLKSYDDGSYMMCAYSPYGFNMINGMTVFIALIVAFISALQWITARQKVVLDLFDKRFAVYEDLIRAFPMHGRESPTIEDFANFTRAANRAQFLFGPEVAKFLQERLGDLSYITVEDNRKEKTPIPSDVVHQTAEQKEYVARLNHMTSFFQDLNTLVEPYMKHTQKRLPMPYIDG